MSVKVIGKAVGYSEKKETSAEIKTARNAALAKAEAVEEEKEEAVLNAVQDTSEAITAREKDDEKEDFLYENKEIAFFTEPKKVKKRSQKHIFAFQSIAAASVCLVMLFLRLFVPELYNNLHLYFLRLFQW